MLVILDLNKRPAYTWNFNLIEDFVLKGNSEVARSLIFRLSEVFKAWARHIHLNCALPEQVLILIGLCHKLAKLLLLVLRAEREQTVIYLTSLIIGANQLHYLLSRKARQPSWSLLKIVCNLQHHSLLAWVRTLKKFCKRVWDTLRCTLFGLVDGSRDCTDESFVTSALDKLEQPALLSRHISLHRKCVLKCWET